VALAFGAVVILALIGVVLFGVVALVERLLFPWAQRVETPTL